MGAGVAGCAVNVTVRSPDAFDRQGLVRAYLAEYGRPPALLAEGAAAALTCQHHPRPVGSWRDVYAASRSSPELVAAGSWLVGYMLRMFRATWLVNLYGALQINATADQFATSFEIIYGMPIDAVWVGGDQRQAGAAALSVGMWAAGVRRSTASRTRWRRRAARAACSLRSICPKGA